MKKIQESKKSENYKSNLSPEQQKIVRTMKFKAWFGDWENDPKSASKVVDENGEPLVVYHRAKTKFYEFEKDKQQIGWVGRGFYFSTSKSEFKEFGKNIIGVFVNARKLFVVEGQAPSDALYEVKLLDKSDNFDDLDISKTLKVKKYNGIKFTHWDRGIIVSCFVANQMKLADGSNTKFSPESDDIRL